MKQENTHLRAGVGDCIIHTHQKLPQTLCRKVVLGLLPLYVNVYPVFGETMILSGLLLFYLRSRKKKMTWMKFQKQSIAQLGPWMQKLNKSWGFYLTDRNLKRHRAPREQAHWQPARRSPVLLCTGKSPWRFAKLLSPTGIASCVVGCAHSSYMLTNMDKQFLKKYISYKKRMESSQLFVLRDLRKQTILSEFFCFVFFFFFEEGAHFKCLSPTGNNSEK